MPSPEERSRLLLPEYDPRRVLDAAGLPLALGWQARADARLARIRELEADLDAEMHRVLDLEAERDAARAVLQEAVEVLTDLWDTAGFHGVRPVSPELARLLADEAQRRDPGGEDYLALLAGDGLRVRGGGDG